MGYSSVSVVSCAELYRRKIHFNIEHLVKIAHILYVNLVYMDTKLTLKLDQEVIEKAKRFAQGQQTSLSQLIENYLLNLTREEGRLQRTQDRAFKYWSLCSATLAYRRC